MAYIYITNELTENQKKSFGLKKDDHFTTFIDKIRLRQDFLDYYNLDFGNMSFNWDFKGQGTISDYFKYMKGWTENNNNLKYMDIVKKIEDKLKKYPSNYKLSFYCEFR